MAAVQVTFSPSISVSLKTSSWCFLLLEHLEEFATLAWYLVADSDLVEEVFLRTTSHLDTLPFDPSIPQLVLEQARSVLITQSIAVLSDARKTDSDTGAFDAFPFGDIPDLSRLAFMLRLVIRLSETQVARYLDMTPYGVRELVKDAIEHLKVNAFPSMETGCFEA